MAKKPFSKSFGFSILFQLTFWFYMVTGATPPDSWGYCTSSLLYCSPLMKAIYSFYTVDHTL